ncbi:hypothetical protein CVD28_24185 [Bacillus sp. M6-12]|nr:hypothetical protein CVD28_24185 [Bacillus sp. M6-12]
MHSLKKSISFFEWIRKYNSFKAFGSLAPALDAQDVLVPMSPQDKESFGSDTSHETKRQLCEDVLASTFLCEDVGQNGVATG